VEEAVFGLDLFIGVVELLGCGLGRSALRCILAYLFGELSARRVVLKPHVDDLRAIRSYTAAGFRKVRLLPEYVVHEGNWVDCWLMEAECQESS